MQIQSFFIDAFVHYEEESIEKLMSICEKVIENITVNERSRFKLKSAIHELIVNSVEHGYKMKSGKIGISFKKENSAVIFEISDEGSGFDSSTLELDRDLDNIDSALTRGWGLYITSKLSAEMKISQNTPNGTKVTVIVPA